jgi:glycine cleavage system H protein
METDATMSAPTDRRYTRTHEWVALEGDVATIGITDFAQSELGDITYLELPEIGDAILVDAAFGIVESVKAANDIFAPVAGEVLERNEEAIAAPETINASPYDRAWLVRVRIEDASQIERLMAAAEYDAFAQAASH